MKGASRESPCGIVSVSEVSIECAVCLAKSRMSSERVAMLVYRTFSNEKMDLVKSCTAVCQVILKTR